MDAGRDNRWHQHQKLQCFFKVDFVQGEERIHAYIYLDPFLGQLPMSILNFTIFLFFTAITCICEAFIIICTAFILKKQTLGAL